MELSIDTSTRHASVGLSHEGRLRGEYTWFSNQNHSVELLPAVEHLLKTMGVALRDLDCIFIARGPGGFSALRVGLSTAKGLAVSWGVPLLALGTLELEAYAFKGLGMPVCPLLDIGRGELAAALYSEDHGEWGQLWAEQVVTPDDLCSRIAVPTLFCGEGVSPVADALRDGLGNSAIIAELTPPTRHPGVLAQLGYQRFLLGERDDLATLEPLYLRRPSITAPRQPR